MMALHPRERWLPPRNQASSARRQGKQNDQPAASRSQDPLLCALVLIRSRLQSVKLHFWAGPKCDEKACLRRVWQHCPRSLLGPQSPKWMKPCMCDVLSSVREVQASLEPLLLALVFRGGWRCTSTCSGMPGDAMAAGLQPACSTVPKQKMPTFISMRTHESLLWQHF